MLTESQLRTLTTIPYDLQASYIDHCERVNDDEDANTVPRPPRWLTTAEPAHIQRMRLRANREYAARYPENDGVPPAPKWLTVTAAEKPATNSLDEKDQLIDFIITNDHGNELGWRDRGWLISMPVDDLRNYAAELGGDLRTASHHPIEDDDEEDEYTVPVPKWLPRE